jgi:hypothetical protein
MWAGPKALGFRSWLWRTGLVPWTWMAVLYFCENCPPPCYRASSSKRRPINPSDVGGKVLRIWSPEHSVTAMGNPLCVCHKDGTSDSLLPFPRDPSTWPWGNTGQGTCLRLEFGFVPWVSLYSWHCPVSLLSMVVLWDRQVWAGATGIRDEIPATELSQGCG